MHRGYRVTPIRALVEYVLAGFRDGFDIGMEGRIGNGSVRSNQSALRSRVQVKKAIQKEIDNNSVVGPFVQPPFEHWVQWINHYFGFVCTPGRRGE